MKRKTRDKHLLYLPGKEPTGNDAAIHRQVKRTLKEKRKKGGMFQLHQSVCQSVSRVVAPSKQFVKGIFYNGGP
jgi:hypothetical protein